CLQRALGLSTCGEGAMAADEAHAGASLVALVSHHRHAADLGGRPRVGATAGLEVEAFGLDQPHGVAGVLGGGHAETLGLGPGDRAHAHWPRRPYDLVGAGYGGG